MTAVCLALLVLLFTYTALSKLLDLEAFKGQMYNQVLPRWLETGLIWTLPEAEIAAVLLLLPERSRLAGLYTSAALMLLFTGYTGLVLLHVFPRVPCSCGGVIQALGWKWHFVFNLFFLLLTLLPIYLTYRERRRIGAV